MLHSVSKLLYPPRCPGCDTVIRPASISYCCSDCRNKLPFIHHPYCFKCGKPIKKTEEYCPDCRKTRHEFDQGRAAFLYLSIMKRAVYHMKFMNRRDYLDFFAAAMTECVQKNLPAWKPEVILPVPMHSSKLKSRGYNQSELLATRIADLTGIPVNNSLLYCARKSGEQKTLSREERRRNLQGCFKVKKDQEIPVRVLLIDDVYTTGSTMDELARILKLAGVREVYFLVLCAGAGMSD